MATTYITQRKVRHNGKRYEKNAVIPLGQDDAEHLLKHGAIIEASDVALPIDPKNGPEDVDDLILFAKYRFGVDLIVKPAGAPPVSSDQLSSAEADLSNKATGLTGLPDVTTLTKAACIEEGERYGLELKPSQNLDELRAAITEARAKQAEGTSK